MKISGKQLISIGLLLAVLPFLINDFYPLPHFLRGFLAGVGLGMEITGLVKLKREHAYVPRRPYGNQL